jgi:hypothetical protein
MLTIIRYFVGHTDYSTAEPDRRLCRPQSRSFLSAIAPQSEIRLVAGRESRDSLIQKGWGMTDLELHLAQEREEIAARIASFRETQQRFEREREEFFVSTWQRVRGLRPLRFWS